MSEDYSNFYFNKAKRQIPLFLLVMIAGLVTLIISAYLNGNVSRNWVFITVIPSLSKDPAYKPLITEAVKNTLYSNSIAADSEKIKNLLSSKKEKLFAVSIVPYPQNSRIEIRVHSQNIDSNEIINEIAQDILKKCNDIFLEQLDSTIAISKEKEERIIKKIAQKYPDYFNFVKFKIYSSNPDNSLKNSTDTEFAELYMKHQIDASFVNEKINKIIDNRKLKKKLNILKKESKIFIVTDSGLEQETPVFYIKKRFPLFFFLSISIYFLFVLLIYFISEDKRTF